MVMALGNESSSYYLYYLILIVVVLLFISNCYSNLSYWHKRGVPQLKGTNILFGDFKNAILFRTSPGYHLGEIHRKSPANVPYVGFYIFHKPCLLLKDPELIKQILVRDFNVFSNRHFAGPQQKDSTGMINLFGLKNPAWRYLRKKILPTLTKSKLKQIVPLMMETGEPMMNYLRAKVDEPNGNIVDAQDVNYKYTADLIANIGLGTKTDSFGNPNSGYSKHLMSFFCSFKRMVALVTVFFMPELVEVIGSSILFDSTFVKKIFWDAVKSREKSGDKRGDYIDSIVMLKNAEQNSLYEFEGDNLFAQSGTLFSGFESSSTLTTFTLMELAKNKRYQDRARDDIRNAVDRHGWNVKAFDEMTYLDQCLSECARLHPPIATIDRHALQDYKIPNTETVIEKGTPVYISLYGMHGDSDFFEEPQVFNPERFSSKRVLSDAYIPFGAGPRKCVGTQFGKMHVKVVLSMILSEYEVHQKSIQENKLDPRCTFTAAADGINILFTKLVKNV